MKGKIITNEQIGYASHINWDKVQLLRYNGHIILSTGNHSGEFFSGTNLTTGIHSTMYVKAVFRLIPPNEVITMQFQNDKDTVDSVQK